jgi:hypothetical protein
MHLGKAYLGGTHLSGNVLRWSRGTPRYRAALAVEPSDPDCCCSRGVALPSRPGFLGAKTGGAAILTPIVRVTFWGALAMAMTAGIGAIVGTVV